MTHPRLPSADLEHILAHTEPLWASLDGKRLFVTGGTGFFGIWLLESLIHARQRLGLDLRSTVLSRSPGGFLARFPHFREQPAIAWLQGDVRDFAFPPEPHACVVHAATETYARTPPTPPLEGFDAIVQGTRRVFDFALHCGAGQVLLTSSGAIYGPQPATLDHVPEDHRGAPDCTSPTALYGEGKRAAELLAALYHEQHGLPVKIARCFAFVGPHLALDKHFAVGNFIADALHGRDIAIQGDGTPLRSYLHAADLVIWLLTILLRGEALRPYNVGSDHALSIAELARAVAGLRPEARQAVHVAGRPVPGQRPARYVPDVSRARRELDLQVRIPLDDALHRTLSWHLPGPAESSHPAGGH